MSSTYQHCDSDDERLPGSKSVPGSPLKRRRTVLLSSPSTPEDLSTPSPDSLYFPSPEPTSQTDTSDSLPKMTSPNYTAATSSPTVDSYSEATSAENPPQMARIESSNFAATSSSTANPTSHASSPDPGPQFTSAAALSTSTVSPRTSSISSNHVSHRFVLHPWKPNLTRSTTSTLPSSPKDIDQKNFGPVLPRVLKTANDVQDLLRSGVGPCMAFVYEKHNSYPGCGDFKCTPYRFIKNVITDDNSKESHNVSFGVSDPSGKFQQIRLLSDSEDQERGLLDNGGSHDDCIAIPFDTTRIPMELFDKIIDSLSRKDMTSMRLVNRRFEAAASRRLFHTVVLDFDPKIFGKQPLTRSKSNSPMQAKPNTKGKGKCRDAQHSSLAQNEGSSSSAGNTPENVDVFGDFGPHIKRYAMAFGVTEQQLLKPHTKSLQQEHVEYWGKYYWPKPGYLRFADRAGLEEAADETSTMRSAFSNLTQVKHLALSLNAGLGWLSGPDLSIRGRVLQRLASPFQPSKHSNDFTVIEQRQLWLMVETAYKSLGAIEDLKKTELVRMQGQKLGSLLEPLQNRTGFPIPGALLSRLATTGLDEDPCELQSHTNIPNEKGIARKRAHSDLQDDSGSSSVLVQQPKSSGSPDLATADDDKESAYKWNLHSRAENALSLTADAGTVSTAAPDCGVVICRQITEFFGGPNNAVSKPNMLTRSQKEWLMETAWAQDAFLGSYLISIADNPSSFQGVKTLTLSPFSSRHLESLQRTDFWATLRNLSQLEIIVIPDWRKVEQDTAAGVTNTPSKSPSEAVDDLYNLLSARVSTLRQLKKVTFGWAAGGEHAEGLMARNKQLLPAPITTKALATNAASSGLKILELPHAESVTLSNCWVTPNALEGWIKHHVKLSLKKLTLDSVSLTAHPASVAGAQTLGHQQQAAGALHVLANQAQTAGAGARRAARAAAAATDTEPPNTYRTVPVEWGGHTHTAWFRQDISQRQALAQATAHQQNSVIAGRFREGSWRDVLTRLYQFFQGLDSRDLELVLLSCGYVHLKSPTINQSELIASIIQMSDNDEFLEPTMDPPPNVVSWWADRRFGLMGDRLMKSDDRLLGALIPAVTQNEMASLRSRWGLEEGWPSVETLGPGYDDDDGWGRWGWRTAEAATYDGHYRGGFGRFSGQIPAFRDVNGGNEDHKGKSTKASDGVGQSSKTDSSDGHGGGADADSHDPVIIGHPNPESPDDGLGANAHSSSWQM